MTPALDLEFRDVRSLAQTQRSACLSAIARIEKKTFPTSEIFLFDEALLKRPNVTVIFAASREASLTPLAYICYVRHKSIALLHKVCVAASHRQKGVGRQLMDHAISTMKSQFCHEINLWVDEARVAARCLYKARGFHEVQRVENYYGPMRHGIQMSLVLSSTKV